MILDYAITFSRSLPIYLDSRWRGKRKNKISILIADDTARSEANLPVIVVKLDKANCCEVMH